MYNMKKIINYLLIAATVCGISFAAASCSKDDDNDIVPPEEQPDNGANSSSDDIGYVECSWDGTQVVKTNKVAKANHIILQYAGKGEEKELPAGTYYIAEKLEMPGVFVIKNGSKVDLILCDGADFKVANIFVDGYGSRLRVFGQEKGTGKLTAGAENTGTKPGIGGRNADGCDLEFHGGTITAQGSHDGDAGAPAIGSYKAFRSVTIYDGTINATGGKCAAGIGGGSISSNATGDIIIYGGNINATGGRYAAGIGGGDNKRVNQINIYGGTVTAYAGADGAGIGGGEDGDSGDITIYGGVVRAYGNVSDGYGAGIGSGQSASVNTIIIKGGDVAAYGGEDAAGIGTGEEYGSGDIISGTIEIHGGKVFAQGKGYGAGIGAGEDATFGVLAISGGRVDAHAGSDCGPWSGGIGAYHSEHEDGCHIGWAGWERIYIGACMRLWTYSPNVGHIENVHYTENWWNFVHQRPQVAFGECNHVDGAYDITNCPYCHSYTLQLR